MSVSKPLKHSTDQPELQPAAPLPPVIPDVPRPDNDYLGSSSLPTDQREITEEWRRFLIITEMEVGWLNALTDCSQPAKFLNEQNRVCASPIFRWITKAARSGNTEFLRNLARAYTAAESTIPTQKVPRQLIQAASELAHEKRSDLAGGLEASDDLSLADW
jgi:hypothetical protein